MKKRWLTGITILMMAVGLAACGGTAETTETPETTETTEAPETTETTEAPETKSENTSEEQADPSQAEGIRPEFREAMDSYEAFFDEYVSFMKKYENASPDDVLAMMDEYTDYLNQYTETMSKMEALDTDDLSTEEALYYTEVSNRISKKLLEVAQ